MNRKNETPLSKVTQLTFVVTCPSCGKRRTFSQDGTTLETIESLLPTEGWITGPIVMCATCSDEMLEKLIARKNHARDEE